MSKPLQIDVFFLVPEGWGVCTTCEMMMAQADLGEEPYERGMENYPPEWQEDFKRLSDTIFGLADRYKEQVQIRVWDPRSLQGMWKSIRHGIRRYPTFLLNGQVKLTGWDNDQLENQIQEAVTSGNSEI